METTQKLNQQILDEATHWLIELNSSEPDHATRQQFDAWLRRSPEHLRAYMELLPLWEDGAALPVGGNASAEDFIAMGKASEGNLICLADSTPAPSKGSARTRFLALAASVLLAAVGATGYWYEHGTYETGIGEHRSLMLADGTTIELNARSKIRVRLTDTRRNIDLLEGQALFRVAKSPNRPFIVTSEKTQVRAVGTEFDVNQRTTGTTVTVLEGRVAVMPGENPGRALTPSLDRGDTPAPVSDPHRKTSMQSKSARPEAFVISRDEVLLSAGEQLTVTPVAIAQPKQVNVAAATAWIERRFVFDGATLGEVTEEFNRYNQRSLVIQDAALRSMPITAAFSSTDPSSLIRFLEDQPGIQVTRMETEIQIRKK